MEKLLAGIQRFQTRVFQPKCEFFARLTHGQEPEALFITCADSRINPNLITQTEPGELFILRNAGNIIPPYGAANGGEGATIEFAVVGLKIHDIIVCGHSYCGAMRGLLEPESLKDMPAVASWLNHAEATRRIMQQKHHGLDPCERALTTVEENVLVQLENLRTHPCVLAGLSSGQLKLHGWVYKIETGEVLSYQPELERFVSSVDSPPMPAVAARLAVAPAI